MLQKFFFITSICGGEVEGMVWVSNWCSPPFCHVAMWVLESNPVVRLHSKHFTY